MGGQRFFSLASSEYSSVPAVLVLIACIVASTCTFLPKVQQVNKYLSKGISLSDSKESFQVQFEGDILLETGRE